MSIHLSCSIRGTHAKRTAMPALSLYDRRGGRKYLTAMERQAFASAASRYTPAINAFCLTLLYTGARVSELLALTLDRIDDTNNVIVIETLKRRQPGVFRALPVPPELVTLVLELVPKEQKGQRIWTWGRTTAWKHVKSVMEAAGIQQFLSSPKAARHGFGVNAIQTGVALNIVQRWMGHARIETTAIYADVIGEEERALARRTWQTLSAL
jgi:integrase